MNEKQILAIYDNDEYDTKVLSLVDDNEWEREYKDYQTRQRVFLHKPSKEHWLIYESRSGSYYTDYHYDEPVATRVYPKEETKVVITWSTKP